MVDGQNMAEGLFQEKIQQKVDRSACYMARYMAKNIVASGLLNNCEIQLAYAEKQENQNLYHLI